LAYTAKVQQRDQQAKRQTDKQTKNPTFLAALVKSEPRQILHGNKGSQASACASKTFGSLTHSFIIAILLRK